MPINKLHTLAITATFIVATVFTASPALAVTQKQCEDAVTTNKNLCISQANNTYFQCLPLCTNPNTAFDGCDAFCDEQSVINKQKCADTAVADKLKCVPADPIKDANGRCNYGVDTVYGGCKNQDGTSVQANTTPCNGFVDPTGACLGAGNNDTANSSAGTSISAQFQQIQDQGLIFGNVCASRTSPCDCRDFGMCQLNDILQVVVNISVFILGISGTLVLVMFIYGGFLWLASHGNEDMVSEGKKTMTGAVVGLIIVFGAYTAITFFISVLTQGTASEGKNLQDVLKNADVTSADQILK
ncbi:hypothetical protein CO173_03385 [Candidatus Uhrbacteria bacterium CG_4_9_14_3_um_filter_41_35]|uniref:DUF4190 domain-containing protein n=1 Tax=Candidatus Uhrbacteria bacterium CG_4_9_14_3_um_filter_41_35 TaxID=1975034 RepID=A0A2M7XET2_9BACT|nr:MAG: hypothetical protein CO173_03385 [Candidatus Uhrbacteria bacterium CG_4_9_14_3_um_filter_41_35]